MTRFLVTTTLILTGEYDTLGPELDALAVSLAAGGADVTHHQYPATDHGFLHFKPVETVRDALGRGIPPLGEPGSAVIAGSVTVSGFRRRGCGP